MQQRKSRRFTKVPEGFNVGAVDCTDCDKRIGYFIIPEHYSEDAKEELAHVLMDVHLEEDMNHTEGEQNGKPN